MATTAKKPAASLSAIVVSLLTILLSYALFRWDLILLWEWKHGGRRIEFVFQQEIDAAVLALLLGVAVFVFLFRSSSRKNKVMLSERTVAVLSALRYRPDAEWDVNILPFGSIYWKDEMPALSDLSDGHDMLTVMKMFGIRVSLWDGEVLDAQDRQLWESVKHQVPDWALFKRLSLSEEQKTARREAERQVEQEFDSLGAEGDESSDG